MGARVHLWEGELRGNPRTSCQKWGAKPLFLCEMLRITWGGVLVVPLLDLISRQYRALRSRLVMLHLLEKQPDLLHDD